MARIFLGITILLIAISAFLSVQTKNRVIGERERADLAAQKLQENNNERAKLVADAKKAKADQEKAAKEKAEAEANAAAAAKEAKLVADQLKRAKDEAEAAKKENESLKSKIAEAPTPAPAPTVDPAQVAAQEEQKQIAAALQAKVAQAEAKANEAEARNKAFELAEAARQRKIGAIGLEGKVLAVNPNWNFVVLNIGDHQGVVANSTMLVKRGGSMVARLRISSVDRVTSIADIIPGSVPKEAKQNSVRPGDVVIYSGS